MDGRNSSGCKISLLNEQPEAPPASRIPQLPHTLSHSSHHHHSNSNPSTSTPNSPAPSLTRSSSSDSGFSPLTPPFNSFDQQPPPHKQHALHQRLPHPQQYFITNQHHSYAKTKKMDDPNASLYPPLPDPGTSLASVYSIPPAPMAIPMLQPQPSQAPIAQQVLPLPQQSGSTSPSSEPSRLSTASSQQSNNKAPPKKNQYPCPMAKQVGCTDFFTTSGHAARHAKKHTGKKDAFCPECNKAFTRKDNMEQHRRTHQNGRGASRSTNDDAKVKKNSKQTAKKNSIKVEPTQLEAAVEQQIADQIHIAQVQQVAQAVQAQAQVQQQIMNSQPPTADPQSILLPAGGPYYLPTVDPGPIPSMPMAHLDLNRPLLQRSSFINNLDYVAPSAALIDPETLHYSYPSPGLSNGLNTLALAAGEHPRLAERSQSSRSPSTESPTRETP